MADKNVQVKISLKDQATKGLKGFLSSLTSIKGVLAAGIGLIGLNKLLSATVGRAQSAETGLKKLAVAMKAAGRFTQENATSFAELSVEIERTTGFLEEDVLQALSVLQTFGSMTRSDMEKTIVATADMATVFNEDLQSAAIRLGKAYNGNLRGLQMMGVGIDAATVKAKGFQSVLDQLAREQGGQAVARMAGFAGAYNRIAVAWGEVGKELGKSVTGNRTIRSVLDGLSGTLQDVAGWIKRKREEETDATDAVREHTKAIKEQEEFMQGLITTGESILLTDKKRAKQLEIEIEQLKKQAKNAVTRNQESSAYLVMALKEKELIEIKKRIAALDSDARVLGSKAQQEKRKAAFEEQQAEKVRENNIIKENAAREEKIKKTIEEIELTQFFHDILEEEADIYTTNKEKALSAAAARVKAIIESDQNISDIEKAALERALEIETEKVRARIDSTERIEAIEQAAIDRELALKLQAAEQEFSARERLEKRLEALSLSKLQKTLSDESLNWAERKQAIGDAEDTAEGFLNTLQNGSITSAVELEQLTGKVEQFSQSMNNVAESGDTLETLNQVFKEISDQSKELSRAIPAPEFDAQAIINSGKSAARLMFDSYKAELERLSRSQKITLPSVKLERPSFLDNK